MLRKAKMYSGTNKLKSSSQNGLKELKIRGPFLRGKILWKKKGLT